MNVPRARARSLSLSFATLFLASVAQPAGAYTLCWLSSFSPLTESYNAAFLQRLRELGFVEGQNLTIAFRSAQGVSDRLPALAADLAKQRCDLVFAPGTEANLAAAVKATQNEPIVTVATDYDPLVSGQIASLARPGGRVTGVSHLQAELPAKRLEILKELLPEAKRFAVLADSQTAGQLALTQAAAKRLGVALDVYEFKRGPYDYDRAFAAFARGKNDAVVALASGLFVQGRSRIPELALQRRLPSMFNNYLWAESGGLLSYGVDFSASYRRAAEQVALIFKGGRPAELPVEQATAVELSINLKTAKALGIAIPPALLARADRVIR
jgi:putative ABC transport system substrate-binding protein